jgi:ABC-2 type transport system permease protein
MRLVALFNKTLIENIRDWKVLAMTLSFAPFFVLLMYFYLYEGTTTYRVVVVNRDEGELGRALADMLQDYTSPDETMVLQVRRENDLQLAQERIRERTADVVIEIPRDFSSVLEDFTAGARASPAVIRSYGDAANIKYLTAAAVADYLTYEYAAAAAGYTGPVTLDAHSIGNVESVNDFALYVPALLALALMMLMFTAAGSLIKEKDKGTLVRLRISNMTTIEWLTAVSLTQVLLGMVGMGLAFLTAVALGYRTSGSLVAVTVIGALSCLAIVGISVVVAAWLRTVFDLMTIGCFPFFVLMFFSGGMMPVPDVGLFSLGERTVNLNEVLPTTHSISALGKIMNLDGGLGDVVYELAAIVVLTVAFYASGTWLFTRHHMRAA